MQVALSEPDCIVCGRALQPTFVPWAFRCEGCGTWRSSLEPSIGERTVHSPDEEWRRPGLQALRERNFETIVDRLDSVRGLRGARVLDVGSAHGWFLEAAARRGADAVGVEPEPAPAAYSRERGHAVREGAFPEALGADERFDVVTFNDVLEHIPDAVATLEAARRHLEPAGLLSINIPTTDGIGYRVGAVLGRRGRLAPFERLWQVGLPSPHVHYFPRAALVRLVAERGFRVRSVAPLRAIVSRGLWQRLHLVDRPSPVTTATYLALLASAPVANSRRLGDIVHVIAERA